MSMLIGRTARIQYVTTYIQQLRQRIGLYRGWIPPTSLVAEAYEALQQDPAVQYAVDHLSLLVAGNNWNIEAKDKRYQQAAQCIEDGLQFVSDFTHARRSITYGALYGLALLKKEWTRKYVKLGGINGLWWVPTALSEIDPRRLNIERDPENRNICYWTLWEPDRDQFIVLENRAACPKAEHSVQDYLWYFDEFEESQGGWGLGLGHKLYSTCLLKSSILQYRAELAEAWARPWLIGKIDINSGILTDTIMGPDGFAKKTDRVSAVLDVLDKMRARHVLVMSKDDELDIREAGATADAMIGSFLDYLDKAIIRLILHTDDTSSQESGSYARQKVYQGEQDCHISYRKNRIEEVLTRDLVQEFIDRNRIHFLRVGIPPENIIYFKVRDEIREEQDKAERRENAQFCVQAGIKLKEEELYEAVGFTRPGPGDAVFIQQQQSPFGGDAPSHSGSGVPGAQDGSQNPFLSKLRAMTQQQKSLQAQNAVYERLLRI